MILSFLLVAAQVVLVGDSTLQVRPDGAPQAGSQATPYTPLNYLEDADELLNGSAANVGNNSNSFTD